MERIIYCNENFDCRVNWLVRRLKDIPNPEAAYFAGNRNTYKILCKKLGKNTPPPKLITDDDALRGKSNYTLLIEDYYANQDFLPEEFGNTTRAKWLITTSRGIRLCEN